MLQTCKNVDIIRHQNSSSIREQRLYLLETFLENLAYCVIKLISVLNDQAHFYADRAHDFYQKVTIES